MICKNAKRILQGLSCNTARRDLGTRRGLKSAKTEIVFLRPPSFGEAELRRVKKLCCGINEEKYCKLMYYYM